MSSQLGWHYRIRLKQDSWIWRAGKGWRQLKDVPLNRGDALCFHNVKLHKSQWFGPVHVVPDWLGLGENGFRDRMVVDLPGALYRKPRSAIGHGLTKTTSETDLLIGVQNTDLPIYAGYTGLVLSVNQVIWIWVALEVPVSIYRND